MLTLCWQYICIILCSKIITIIVCFPVKGPSHSSKVTHRRQVSVQSDDPQMLHFNNTCVLNFGISWEGDIILVNIPLCTIKPCNCATPLAQGLESGSRVISIFALTLLQLHLSLCGTVNWDVPPVLRHNIAVLNHSCNLTELHKQS